MRQGLGAVQPVRQPDNRWFLTTYEHPDDVIVLPSIDCTLALADVYRRVTFPTPT